jgi:TetR/AcrR family transcriptional regulator, transcriptional repressor for nem operon
MGHSQDEKAASHRKIVEVAAVKMREGGTDGPGVAEIMGAAGLTHGGFYKHFGSRDELVAEAVELAIEQGREGRARAVEGAADPLAAFVDWYLSPTHRDDAAGGCAVVALGADATRSGERVRAAYTGQVEHYIRDLEAALAERDGAAGEDDPERRREAIAAVSAMVGALLMSRAVDDPELSEEILGAVRASVAKP